MFQVAADVTAVVQDVEAALQMLQPNVQYILSVTILL